MPIAGSRFAGRLLAIAFNGSSAVGPLGPRVLDRELHFDPRKGIRGKTYTSIGGMIEDRPIDLKALGLDDRSASAWDECHLIFAETAAQAWRHAKLHVKPAHESKVGVYIGHSGGSRMAGDLIYGTMAESTAELLRETPGFEKFSAKQQQSIIEGLASAMHRGRPTRQADGRPYIEASAAARLVAQILNLNGPQMVLDAACASSLVALG